MECVELAPAFEPPHTSDSGSKLHALHTLRETDRRCPPPMQFASYPPGKSAQKNKIFGYIIQGAGPRPRKYGGALRTGAPYPPLLLRHYSPARISSWLCYKVGVGF